MAHQDTADTTAIRALLGRWTTAIRAHDLDAILVDHADDIRMFDVPEPLEYDGIDAYRGTWPRFFRSDGAKVFELHDLRLSVGDTVAFAHALIRCQPVDHVTGRVTVGFEKRDGRWQVVHEHHSFPIHLDGDDA